MEKYINYYKSLGYEIIRDFPDEYILMGDTKNGLYVRLYYNGKIIENKK